jgi:uncharacterized RDD family membrane protein YckC
LTIDTRLLRRRVGAYLLDILVLFLALGPTGWLIQQRLGWAPATGPQIWWTLLLNFSVPTWLYFTIADASRGGATFGKRWLRLRVAGQDGGRLTPIRAVCRTAARLLPWELVHISAFALETQPGDFSIVQSTGLVVANVLVLAYVACAVLTQGRRSIHDAVAGSAVRAVA